ncbi:MAG: hypothetical protein OHK006_03250 [Thermodesulfovibrionales bacterium]
MRWEALISTQNLKLAWRRINTGRNLQYKRFFREAYLVYESAVDEHIRSLHSALKVKAWKPNHASRLYLPKPSGLQRPLSLLGVEDQIVLQALANIFGKKLLKKRQRVEMKTVFSNKLASPNDSIFFMEHWQTTYRAFQKKCEEVFEAGYKWSAHFDLSAYYDTISHDLLMSIVSPGGRGSPTLEIVKEWLQVWSASDRIAMKAHGIPQGPIASDFLAEAFFLPIDLQLQKTTFHYLRYVDDIRLFGKTENEVRDAAILLEQECRHRGLIPQSSKFEIRELQTVEDAMGALPSISPTGSRDPADEVMSAEQARKLLSSAVGGKPFKVRDKSRFRYLMYRAPEDRQVLGVALKLLPRHPEHIDAFTAYFANFDRSKRIVKAVVAYLNSGLPYSYVRGELWHVLARLANKNELEEALHVARSDAKRRSRCVALSWGVMHFLMRCEREGLARIGRRLVTEHPISRSLLAPLFADGEFSQGGQGVTLLKGEQMEQLAGARELQKRGLQLTTLGLRQRDLSPSCKTALMSLGVIRRRHRRPERDWISEILVDLYGCQPLEIWRALLASEYEHASQILIEAKARFHGARSEWLGLQDSFNDLVIRQILGFLKTKGLPGHAATTDRNGKLIKYGVLIAKGGAFDGAHQRVADTLRQMHHRRNSLPGSHPYDEKGGSRNRWLTKKEQDALVVKLRSALDSIATVVDQNR